MADGKPPVKIEEEQVESENCSICWESLNDPLYHVEKMLNCTHTFHSDCIKSWLVIRSSCPLCRSFAPPSEDVLGHVPISVPDLSGDEDDDDFYVSIEDLLMEYDDEDYIEIDLMGLENNVDHMEEDNRGLENVDYVEELNRADDDTNQQVIAHIADSLLGLQDEDPVLLSILDNSDDEEMEDNNETQKSE